ncbi:MAG: adenylate/guanylate cyclase domain-containing protein, partial [Anaerolineaceae bacterium]
AAIDGLHDAGNIRSLRGQGLGGLAVAFDRLGHYDAAATLMGTFEPGPSLLGLQVAVGHLREVLGDETFERLSREGAAMEVADAVRYAHAQIQLARTELLGES